MSVRQHEEERQQREQKLIEENKRLREALEFYANKESYKVWREGLNPDLDCIHDVDFDNGNKARKALAGD